MEQILYNKMQDADDWDKNVKHYLKLRGYDVVNYRGDYSLNPSVPSGGYLIGDIVRDSAQLYLSLEGTFEAPNTDGVGSSKWKQLTGDGSTGLQYF